MTLGPLEFIVIGFEGNHFTGEIWPQFNALRENGTIRVVDLLFVKKDVYGAIEAVEISDLNDEEAAMYTAVSDELQGLLTPEDVQMLTASLPPNSSAAIAVLEYLWARGLKEAIKNAQGVLITDGLVPPAIVAMIENEHLAASGTASKGGQHV